MHAKFHDKGQVVPEISVLMNRQRNYYTKIFHFWQEKFVKSIVNQAIKPVKTEMTVIKTIALDNKTKVKNMKTDVKVRNRKVPNQFFHMIF